MVLLAWIGFVGSWIVGIVGGVVIASVFFGAVVADPTVDVFASAFGSMLDQTVILSVITEIMTAFGAVLLVMIIAQIESRASARDAEIRAQLGPAPLQVADGPVPVPGPVPDGAPVSTVGPPPAPSPAPSPARGKSGKKSGN